MIVLTIIMALETVQTIIMELERCKEEMTVITIIMSLGARRK